jgi:hypothetical protein
MEGITLSIAIAGSIAVFLLRPPYALAVYVVALLGFPDYLRVSIGTADMSVGRIIVTFLLLRSLLDEQLRKKFVWSSLDTCVSCALGGIVIVYCLACGLSGDAVVNRCGLVMDTFFAYIAARFIITDKDGLVRFTKIIALFLVPLAIYGMVEAVTGWQPIFQLVKYRTWRTMEAEGLVSTQARWGFTRAIGPFSHPILFGDCFAMFLPLVWALRHQVGKWHKGAYLVSAIVVLGAFSSMSSGSWGALVVVLFCLAMQKYKRWTKYIIVLFIALCVLTMFISNRSLHHVVLSYINLGKGDWWQRARLIDAAIDNFGEWWLTGYGNQDPGWGRPDGTGYFYGHFTDANNQFIFYGIQGGAFAMISLLLAFVMAFRGLVSAGRKTNDIELKSFYWSMGCSLVCVIAAWQGVSFFGQANALFYIVLGVIGSSVSFTKHPLCNNQEYRYIQNGYYDMVYGDRKPKRF